ncbi:hypothetical protein CEXT_150931 [Caerostris extrusa]|uniref:Uncharacterized protein n=1 Tax=Caerostris extrusa TaxID=172846 RepID=A0AAV4YDG5_CAEEX|nr:hypothetical protein CEXT_150931 [Caerostris extrusa]
MLDKGLALVTQKPLQSQLMQLECKMAFLDAAFERLLGPCMAIMSRMLTITRNKLLSSFGSEANISDLR